MAEQLSFFLLQLPRQRIHTLACLCGGKLSKHRTSLRSSSCMNFLNSQVSNLEHAYSKRWVRGFASSKADGRTRKAAPSSIQPEILNETVSIKSGVNEMERIHCFNIQQRIAENKEACKHVAVLTFDIETTGLDRVKDRIIEVAFQDLRGGKNSTFQTLINPDCEISYHSYLVHKITNHMVINRDVPRMKELAPILVQYITSRHMPQGYVLLVAHNGRSFDFPFLVNEFNRCNVEIPSNWFFLDSLQIARQFLKSEGGKENKKAANLPALVELFNIQSSGTAHRAMSDVESLSMVFKELTFRLKLPISELLKLSFTAADLKKKS